MRTITAMLHTQNDGLRLGRALETLYACDNILVVDHGSHDATIRIAREYGATVTHASAETSPRDYLRSSAITSSESHTTDSRWILCLEPCESLTEKLAARLFDWKFDSIRLGEACSAYSVLLREETAHGWIESSAAQTRLVPHNWTAWNGPLPAHEPAAITLEGELLRFAFP